ncbi:MAG: hypothetical protein ACO3ZW_04275 [Opitutales bacterium]|jgi:hypothetical protein
MSGECQSGKTAPAGEQKKQGFFQRMFRKLDDKMKEKAEKSSSCCCCESDTDKDTKDTGKCC